MVYYLPALVLLRQFMPVPVRCHQMVMVEVAGLCVGSEFRERIGELLKTFGVAVDYQKSLLIKLKTP